MASFGGGSYFFERRKKNPNPESLRSLILSKIAARLKIEEIAVIGAESSGRNSLVRRFLHMSRGPFSRPQDEKYHRRSVLIDLSERPYIRRAEIVKLKVHILNGRTRSYEELNELVPSLRSIAMVYDVGSERTVNIATSCVLRIRGRVGSLTPPIIMVGNKIDLPVPEDVLTSVRVKARECEAAGYYECSAMQNINMDPVLDAILIMTFFPGRPLPQ